MIRSLIVKTLGASAVFVVCLMLQGCDGGSSTGPQGQTPREADPNVPPVPSPGESTSTLEQGGSRGTGN